jgi:AraC-like DNA-binding protein
MIYRLSLQSPTEYATISSISTAIVSILNKKEDDCDFIERLISTIINRFCDVDFNLIKEMSDTGYATDYVRTLFKKKTGITPLKYLTELRLKCADNLLKISNMSVSDVATSSGFSDPLYFSKLYKNKYGVSPKIRQKEQRYEKI